MSCMSRKRSIFFPFPRLFSVTYRYPVGQVDECATVVVTRNRYSVPAVMQGYE